MTSTIVFTKGRNGTLFKECRVVQAEWSHFGDASSSGLHHDPALSQSLGIEVFFYRSLAKDGGLRKLPESEGAIFLPYQGIKNHEWFDGPIILKQKSGCLFYALGSFEVNLSRGFDVDRFKCSTFNEVEYYIQSIRDLLCQYPSSRFFLSDFTLGQVVLFAVVLQFFGKGALQDHVSLESENKDEKIAWYLRYVLYDFEMKSFKSSHDHPRQTLKELEKLIVDFPLKKIADDLNQNGHLVPESLLV